MSAKEDSVNAGLASIQQAQADALGKCFDDGLASAPSGGGLSQADCDAQVAIAVAAQKASDDQALEDLKAQLAAIQALEASEAEKLSQIKVLLG